MRPQTPRNSGKLLFYITESIAFLTIIIVAIVLTFMHKTTPNLRFHSLTVETLTLTNSSFSISLNAQITLKNSNFGQFRFPDGRIAILHRGSAVGDAVIPGGRAKARSTEKMNVTVAVQSRNDDGEYLSLGKITLWSNATLKGKIRVIKRRATATMNCTMDVDIRTTAVQNLKCS